MPPNKIKEISNVDFTEYVVSSNSWPELMTKLGYKDFMSSGRKTIKKRIQTLSLDESHLTRTSALMKGITDDYFKEIVISSTNWPDLIQKCGYKMQEKTNEVGESWTQGPFSAKKLIKERIIGLDLSISHFTRTPRHLRKTNNLVNRRKTGNQLKKILLKSGREYICEWCRCEHFAWRKNEWYWYDRQITLQIDHINGITGKEIDNAPESLRFLCPNCHSTTDNFCGKSNRGKMRRDILK